jgi:hypothetical protein
VLGVVALLALLGLDVLGWRLVAGRVTRRVGSSNGWSPDRIRAQEQRGWLLLVLVSALGLPVLVVATGAPFTTCAVVLAMLWAPMYLVEAVRHP